MTGRAQSLVLVVDDNRVDRMSIKRAVGDFFEIAEAATAAEAREFCRQRRPDCVLLDYRLPDEDGLQVLESLAADGIAVVMLTGQGDEETAVAAMKSGAHDYLVKGGMVASLKATVQNAISKHGLERRVQEQSDEVAASRERLFRVLEALPVGVHVLDAAGESYYANRRAVDLMGLADGAERAQPYLRGTDDPYPRDRDPINRALRGEASEVDDLELRGAGRRRSVRMSGVPIFADDGGEVAYAVACLLDVTEQRELEAQLLQAQKMEAIGRLAGGVAHDFNNLLTAILSFTNFAIEGLGPADPARADLKEVLKAAGRAARLTGQLLAFSRKRPIAPQVIDPSEQIRSLEKMLLRVVGEHIEVVADYRRSAPIRIDPGAFEQVVVNLVVNARDAMPSGGKLRIEIDRELIEEPKQVSDGTSIEPGDYVAIAVSDTGLGMDVETRQRIFEPFFTTKGVFEGTGLGLSTCYGIVTQAGGHIEVRSERGSGTTFRVYYPVFEGEELPVLPADRRATVGGNETILVVEDDHQVRRLCQRTLEHLGYRVFTAADGAEALDQWESPDRRIDLLLTDVVMPRMNGRQLAQRMSATRPEMKVLFMSGYTQNEILTGRGGIGDNVALVQKPFTPNDIAHRLREVLDSDGHRARELRGTRISLLVVDEDPAVLDLVESRLAGECDVLTATSGEAALELIKRAPPDIILCEYRLPRMSGRHLFESVAAHDPGLVRRFIFMTEEPPKGLRDLVRASQLRLLEKPLDKRSLVDAVTGTAGSR